MLSVPNPNAFHQEFMSHEALKGTRGVFYTMNYGAYLSAHEYEICAVGQVNDLSLINVDSTSETASAR